MPNYDIFAKLSQLDVYKPTRMPPYCLLIMSLQETGSKMASTAAIWSQTLIQLVSNTLQQLNVLSRKQAIFHRK